ncbi:hypothetical protein ACQEU3_40725 [Spirillospora sp. CA-253888]
MPTLHTGIDCKCPRAILVQTDGGDYVVAIVTCHGPAHAPRPPRTTVILIKAEDVTGEDFLDANLRVLLDEALREGLAFGHAVSMTLDARCVEDLADAVVGVALKIIVVAAFTVADTAAVVARLHDEVETAHDPADRKAVASEALEALRDRGIQPDQIRRITLAGEVIRAGGAVSPAQTGGLGSSG